MGIIIIERSRNVEQDVSIFSLENKIRTCVHRCLHWLSMDLMPSRCSHRWKIVINACRFERCRPCLNYKCVVCPNRIGRTLPCRVFTPAYPLFFLIRHVNRRHPLVLYEHKLFSFFLFLYAVFNEITKKKEPTQMFD